MHPPLDVANRDSRIMMAILEQPGAGSTILAASAIIPAHSVLRRLRAMTDGGVNEAAAIDIRLAIARTASPVLADFHAGNTILPSLGQTATGNTWHPDPGTYAPWLDVNIRLADTPTHLLLLCFNGNSETAMIHLQFLIDLAVTGAHAHGSR